MLDAVCLSHLVVRGRLRAGGVAVDATVGNGHDTLFLARHLGPQGAVHGFDVQAAALDSARRRLTATGGDLATVHLHQCGHEQADLVLRRHHVARIDAAIFNLGYLPGGDKSLTTRPETTVQALRAVCTLLAAEAVLCVVAYLGHAGGIEERDAVLAWAGALESPPWVTGRYTVLNRGSASAELLVIERLGAPASAARSRAGVQQS